MADQFTWPDEAVETAASALCEDSMDVADRLEIPRDVWDQAESDAEVILAAVAPIVQARIEQAWDEGIRELVEIHEVVDRLTGRRAMEIVHLSAIDALDWLEGACPAERHHLYRAQSVKVYRHADEIEGGA